MAYLKLTRDGRTKCEQVSNDLTASQLAAMKTAREAAGYTWGGYIKETHHYGYWEDRALFGNSYDYTTDTFECTVAADDVLGLAVDDVLRIETAYNALSNDLADWYFYLHDRDVSVWNFGYGSYSGSSFETTYQSSPANTMEILLWNNSSDGHLWGRFTTFYNGSTFVYENDLGATPTWWTTGFDVELECEVMLRSVPTFTDPSTDDGDYGAYGNMQIFKVPGALG